MKPALSLLRVSLPIRTWSRVYERGTISATITKVIFVDGNEFNNLIELASVFKTSTLYKDKAHLRLGVQTVWLALSTYNTSTLRS
jgi:hypothetical protein